MKGHCSVVDPECEAPAGMRTASGYAELKSKNIPSCSVCGGLVCKKCSKVRSGRRICNGCLDEIKAEKGMTNRR
jgi:hypothetical protein